MRRINKSEEPQSLTAFNQSGHQDWKEIHDEKNRHVYKDCLERCIKNQNNLCGYTEMPLTEGNRHIDHYIKRDFAPDLTFCWNNMIAAVKDSRFGADFKDKNIGRDRYDRFRHCYTNILNPLTDEFAGRFRFSADGTVEAANDDDLKAKETINLFNLNAPSLKACRKRLMESVRAYAKGGLTKEEILDWLKCDGFVSATEFELSFVNE